jgi:hypothetical protein
MMHGISEAEWLQYAGGTLESARAEAIRVHVTGCAECAQVLRDLTQWHYLLNQEGARLRSALALPDPEMEGFVERSLQRIRHADEQRGGNWSPAEGKFLLRSLMEPIFGAGTARVTIDLAVHRSTTHPEGGLNRGNWRLFVVNLSDAVASICGSAAGRLVNHAGIGLRIEEA